MPRIIYSSNAVCVSDSPGYDTHTGFFEIKTIDRIQSASASVSSEIKRYKQLGSDDYFFDAAYPTAKVSCEISYYCSDSSNEAALGINTDNSSIFLGQNSLDKNINLLLLSDNQDGRDVASLSDFSGVYVFGIGNAYITNYSVRGGVGDVPNVSVSFLGNNVLYDSYTGRNSVPSLNQTGSQTQKFYTIYTGSFNKTNYISNQTGRPLAIRPTDVFVRMSQPNYAGGIYETVTGKIQSFEINVPFERKELAGFGSNAVYNQKLMLPSVGSLSLSALFEFPQTGNYSGVFNFSAPTDIQIELQDCSGNQQIVYSIDQAKLTSENFNFSIGPHASFDGSFEFSANERRGFRISGAAQRFDDDADVFLRTAAISDTTIRTAVNSFVEDLKYNGLWYKMSGVYPFVGGTEYTHKLNLRDPRDADSAFRLGFSGSGTQHSSSGVYFSGTGDYANTFFNPYSNLTGVPVHMSMLFLSDEDMGSADIGCISIGGANPRLLVVAESSSFGGAIFDCYDYNTGRCMVSGAVNSQAFYAATRTSNTGEQLLIFRNSTTPTYSASQTGNISGLSKPNYNMYLGAVNTSGTPQYTNSSNRKFGFLSIGDGLTSGECVELYTIVKDFQTALGRNSSVFV